MAATATTLKILIFDMAPSGAPRESNGSAFLRAEQPSRHDEVPHCFFDRSERNIDRKPALPTRLNRRRRFDGARNRRARSLLLSPLGHGAAMKLIGPACAIFIGLGPAFAYAQGASGRGATTGDPAASSATPSAAPGTSPTTGSSGNSNPSGSGTSTSGGSDANGDQGRDTMPDNLQGERPVKTPNKR